MVDPKNPDQENFLVPGAGVELPKWPGPPPVELNRGPSQTKKWLPLGLGLVLVLVGLAIWFTREPAMDVSDLPVYFQQAHSIKATKGAGTVVKGLGIFLPPQVAAPAKFNDQWLEEKFTHYMGEDGFVWANPAKEFPDGKILRGNKVVFGKQWQAFSLICTYAPGIGVVNMWISSPALRDRSQGPPPAPENKDD